MKKILLTMLAVAAMVALSRPVKADTIDDPLHGFCWNGTTCSDNGTNTPTTSNPPYFGFYISPGPQTGTYLIDILVPTSYGIQPSFSVSGDLSGTATLFSSTAWSSGDLADYLGLATTSPDNPIGAYLAGGSSYYVYQVNLGTATLQNSASGSPDLTIVGGVPVDTYIVGFLLTTNCGTSNDKCVATANSGAILETGQVPEPGSLMLFGTGLLGMAGFLRRKLMA
jgi:PEP-CTERM motif